MRNASQLKPGCYYRLTDYQCTTTQEDTQADNKIFDILILALFNNKLSEECRAIHNKIDKSLDHCNLNAWKLWYCLDNDTNKFAWADTNNGKGVIYRMIDEFGNDCPYDFKNIMFKRFKVEDIVDIKYIGTSENIDAIKVKFPDIISDTTDFKFYHTFALFDNDTKQSIEISTLSDFNIYLYENFCNNIIKPNYNGIKYSLPNNIFITPLLIEFYNNTLGNNCIGNTFLKSINNTLGNDCIGNIIFGDYNIFGNDCNYNIFGYNCNHITFGNDCNNILLGSVCNYNTFGNNCGDITFGNNCRCNSFGNDCNMLKGGSTCNYNTFGNNCGDITFGYKNDEEIILFDNYENNIFDNCCGYNIFGNKQGDILKIQNWHIQLSVRSNTEITEYIEIEPTINEQNYLVRVFVDKNGVLNIVDSN